jgi:hypothetical protein
MMISDKTKCSDRVCPFKDSCFRFTSQPRENFQWWFDKPPRTKTDCEQYYGAKTDYVAIKSRLERKYGE